jgi:hypothetical protein
LALAASGAISPNPPKQTPEGTRLRLYYVSKAAMAEGGALRRDKLASIVADWLEAQVAI